MWPLESYMQDRILQKSHELFFRYGIRSVSMDEIAAHLGMSKKTIYQFFADKDALVEGVIEIEIEKNVSECSYQKTTAENPIQEIFMSLDKANEMMTQINPSLLFELEKYHPKAFRKFSDHKNKFMFNLIKDNLVKGIEEGLYRADIDPDIITRFRLASIFMIFNHDHFPPGKVPLTQVLDEVTYHFLFGITTHKGEKLIQQYKIQRQKQ